jgi:hypothetical protein
MGCNAVFTFCRTTGRFKILNCCHETVIFRIVSNFFLEMKKTPRLELGCNIRGLRYFIRPTYIRISGKFYKLEMHSLWRLPNKGKGLGGYKQ